MKKILAILLALSLICCLFAGCGGSSTDTSSGTASGEQTFQKPENYASVVKVTINPEFNLYLDENGFVLAVEPLNDDAKAITIKVTEENKEISTFVKELVSETKEKGFLKDNAEIKVETEKAETLAEKVAEAVAAIEETFKTEASALGITVTVEVVEKEETTSSDVTSSDATSSDVTSSTPVSSNTSSQTPPASSNTSSTPPAPTVYSQYAMLFTSFSDTHPFDINMVIDFGVGEVTQSNRYLTETDQEYGMWKKYTVPEAAMLTALRRTFVITDGFWNSIKAQELYNLGADECVYMDGNFYITTFDGWGGEDYDRYYFKKLTDDKNGNITIYYLYIYNDEPQHYIEVTYTYSGSASYELIEDKDHFSAGLFKSTSKAFIDSLRLKSVKKTENYPGNPYPQKQMDYFYNGTSYYFFWYESDPNHVECFGFGGEESIFCGCLERDLTKERWDYNTATKAITCPCGETVITEFTGEIKRYE